MDDHSVVRDGVRRMLEELPEQAQVGEAASREEALERLGEGEWDLLMLDISLRGQSGLDLLREVKATLPSLPVLVLSMHSEEQYARRAFKAGASGYIMKDSSRTELLGAIDRVMQGGRYVSPGLAERLVIDLDGDLGRPPHDRLSSREFEVLRLIGSGKAINEIAQSLSLSDKTVSTYKARILEKLGLRTTADIVRYVIDQRLLE